MTGWEALVLGLIQGLTEFFPVSSSGHLVMAQQVLGLRLPGVGYEVWLHLGTLGSVLLVYRQRLARLVRGCFRDRSVEAWAYVGKLALATVPAVVAVLLFDRWIEARFEDPAFTATALLATGCFLWSLRWAQGAVAFRPLEAMPVLLALGVAVAAGTGTGFALAAGLGGVLFAVARLTARRSAAGPTVDPPTPIRASEPEPGWGSALAMGCGQALAILPGVSRSGTTICAGLWRRVDPVAAAEFSFLMSVVAILEAAVRKFPELRMDEALVGPVPMAVGFLAALLGGVLAIRFFVALLRGRRFHMFAWYCWVAGLLFLAYLRGRA